jgi:hypothetical protein
VDPGEKILDPDSELPLFIARVALPALGYQPHVELLPHPEHPSRFSPSIDTASGHPPGQADNELYEALLDSPHQPCEQRL